MHFFVCLFFTTKPYKIRPFLAKKAMKTAPASSMFDAKNISARSYMYQIRLKFLLTGSKITLTPSRHQIHLKTEMKNWFMLGVHISSSGCKHEV